MLDGEDLKTLIVTVDGEKGAFSVTPNALTIADVPDTFALHSVVRIAPDANTPAFPASREALTYSKYVIPAQAGIQENQRTGPRLSPG